MVVIMTAYNLWLRYHGCREFRLWQTFCTGADIFREKQDGASSYIRAAASALRRLA
jgi:hypothetical protein